MTEPPRRPIAIALDYAVGTAEAPRVVAKGEGAVAETIIATAKAHGVAIEADPALAVALSAVEVDDRIPPELYRAVAEVLAFVLRAAGRL